ncbi:glycosyltransferase family 2 protein [Arthrobacter sp. UYEF3]|uniref:glycosyltransferase n=1 Tax=Arthrobacter sp. UYEF3 TaxID=1756365 RepID=UPI003394AA2F
MSLWFEIRGALRRRGEPTLLDEWPAVSIIVAAFNEAGVIEDCVRSIQLTSYDRYEVVLVDDGSTDTTAELMRGLAGADLRIKVLGQAHAGTAAALNLGLRHAAGEVVMLVDAKGVLSRHTVKRMLQGFGDWRTGAVCGDRWPVKLDRLLTRKAALNIRAYRRSVLEDAGPFREDTADVRSDLTRRVRRAGYLVGSAPGHWD